MTRLKVLTVITNFGRHGAGVTLERFLQGIDPSRIELELCTIAGVGPEYERFRKLGFPIHVLSRVSKYDISMVWRLKQQILRGGYHLVYTSKHSSAFLARPAAAWARVPVLVHERGSPLQFVSPLVLWADRRQSRGSHLVVANSQSTADTAQRVLGISKERLRVIYNPVPPLPTPLPRITRSGDAPVLGYFGRLTAAKGVDILIRSFASVRKQFPGAELRITGEGPLLSDLKSQVAGAGLGDSVVFSPWQDDALPAMGEVDMVVVPSLYEPFGNVVTEAALAQTPVLAARVGGIPEILDRVGHGVTVVPRLELGSSEKGWMPAAAHRGVLRRENLKALSPADLAQAMVELWEDPEKRSDLSRNSFERVQEVFSTQRYVNNMMEVMLEASGHKQPLPGA